MFEVEIKARLTHGQYQDIENILQRDFQCPLMNCLYHDTYFDTRNNDLTATGRELRLRRVSGHIQDRVLLTSKEPPFDEITRSKVEHEIEVSSYDEALALVTTLGFTEDVAFQKYCSICSVDYSSYQVGITLVEIAELPEKYIELEILISDAEHVNESMAILHELTTLLHIDPEQITNEYYTNLVRKITG